MAAVVLVLLPASAGAQGGVAVNSFEDSDDGSCAQVAGDCTLREAMLRTPAQTIVDLPAGRYELTGGALPVGDGRFLVGAGARATTIQAVQADRVMIVTDGDASVSGVTISGGNHALGGGIFVGEDGELNLFNSTVSFNQAQAGGGIYSDGLLHVERSTIMANDATGSEAHGGGLAIANGDAELFHSTITTNFSAETGAGLWTAANVELENVTIAGNEAREPEGTELSTGGGIQQAFNDVNDLTVASNTLVVENFGGNCLGTSNDQIQARFSMADDMLCNVPQEPEFGNVPIAAGTARISSLEDNGGPTDTHALLAGSPAIGAAEDGSCEGGFDQRGLQRPQGVTDCDIGAYERATALTATATDDDDTLCTPGPGGCSVREAIDLVADDGHVTVPAGAYLLNLGALEIVRTVEIAGAGARVTTLIGSGSDRVLRVLGGEESIVAGVTITGGDVTQAPIFERGGGGIAVDDAGLTLLDSTVEDNAAGFGGGVFNTGGFIAIRSTIARNRATGDLFASGGGGVFTADRSVATLTNSTVSGNSATGIGGGIASIGAQLELIHVTLAGNSLGSTLGTGSGLYHEIGEEDGQEYGSTLIQRSLIAGNPGTGCAGGGELDPESEDNVTDDGSCPALQFESAGLAELGDYGGPTDTHALLAGSPAIDSAGNPPACELGHDQRSEERPVGAECDAGAFETDEPLPAGTLRVAATVINNEGGSATASGLRVNVRSGDEHILGSPRPGDTEGRDYLIEPGDDYIVSGTGSGYTASVGGDCLPDGTVTVEQNEVSECLVTFNDNPVPPSSPPGGSGGGGGSAGTTQPPPDDGEELPPPEAGEEVNALPKSGTVRVKVAGTNRFVELEEGQQIPVGSVIDTTKGRVTIIAAGGQSADFYDGIFRLSQGKGAKPLTTLTLVEALSCPKAGNAVAAAKKKKRRLWGDGNGKFRTKGKHSAATVVGTRWLVEDSCKSTLTRVVRGRVSVRDFVKKKTVIVRAGKKYVARARR